MTDATRPDLAAAVRRVLAAPAAGLAGLGFPALDPSARADALAALGGGPWSLVDLERTDEAGARRALEAAWDADPVVVLCHAEGLPAALLALVEAILGDRPDAPVGSFGPLLRHRAQRWVVALEGAPDLPRVPAALRGLPRWQFA